MDHEAAKKDAKSKQILGTSKSTNQRQLYERRHSLSRYRRRPRPASTSIDVAANCNVASAIPTTS
jgi:hypothetical protein